MSKYKIKHIDENGLLDDVLVSLMSLLSNGAGITLAEVDLGGGLKGVEITANVTAPDDHLVLNDDIDTVPGTLADKLYPGLNVSLDTEDGGALGQITNINLSVGPSPTGTYELLKVDDTGHATHITPGTDGQVLTQGTGDVIFADAVVYTPPAGSETIYVAHIPITAGEIRACHTTPIPIIATPGTGKYIRIFDIVYKYTWNTANFTGTYTSLTFVYGTSLTQACATAKIQAGVDAMGHNYGSNIDTTPSSFLNLPVNIKIPSAVVGGAASDSFVSLVVDVAYRIVDFN